MNLWLGRKCRADNSEQSEKIWDLNFLRMASAEILDIHLTFPNVKIVGLSSRLAFKYIFSEFRFLKSPSANDSIAFSLYVQ